MKRVSILAIAFLSVSLAQSGFAQTTVPPAKADSGVQTKQDKQAAKAKAKADKAASKQGKKTTTTQDVAYALAYKAGIPK
jgi:hypothetical protein